MARAHVANGRAKEKSAHAALGALVKNAVVTVALDPAVEAVPEGVLQGPVPAEALAHAMARNVHDAIAVHATRGPMAMAPLGPAPVAQGPVQVEVRAAEKVKNVHDIPQARAKSAREVDRTALRAAGPKAVMGGLVQEKANVPATGKSDHDVKKVHAASGLAVPAKADVRSAPQPRNLVPNATTRNAANAPHPNALENAHPKPFAMGSVPARHARNAVFGNVTPARNAMWAAGPIAPANAVNAPKKKEPVMAASA